MTIAVIARGVPQRTPRAPLLAATVALVALALVGGLFVALRSAPSAPAATGVSAIASVIEKFERRALADGGRTEIRALLATPAYFAATGQQAIGRGYGAERDLVLFLSEEVHFGDLPAARRPVALVDDRAYVATRVDVLVEAAHHRTSVLVYADTSQPLTHPATGLVELRVTGATGDLTWDAPFADGRGASTPLSVPMLLALFGGLLASMWPCLFQLSAYFLPSVAGLSLDQAREGRDRMPVLRTAVLFVSGIVVVYTLAGLAAGFAAQSLAGSSLFESARRPLTLVAGVVILAMAVRLALRARAPLACKMPVTSGRRFRGSLGTVALGLAFATGCMTCFGAALVLGMFTYVVTTASPLVGAAVLFVFSLGIAVPLVAAAVAMARVLPLLGRLERSAPYLTLASAGIMAVYGALILTDSSHVLSDAISSAARIVR